MQDLNKFTDQQLIKEYLRDENQAALDFLISKYLQAVYNFVFKYVHTSEEAEDVTQEAFVKAWNNLNKYNPKFNFKTWVFTIAKNTALDHLKKKGLVPFSALENEENPDFAAAIIDRKPLTEEILVKFEDAAIISRALEHLPESQRQLISLHYHQGFKLREIAEQLKQSVNTIKTRHRRALLALKKYLQEK